MEAALEVGRVSLIGYLLVMMRMAGLLLFAPPLSSMSVPLSLRMAVVLALTAAVMPASTAINVPSLAASLPVLALGEFGFGVVMSLGMNLGMAAFGVASRLIDVQVGFGVGQVLDPNTHLRTPAISAAFALIAPTLLLLADVHHLVLRAFVLGMQKFPPGGVWSAAAFLPGMLTQLQALFTLGLAMVAPVVFCLVLVELGLGVMARNLPQMNVFLIGIPVKVATALVALAAWMAATSRPMMRVFDSVFQAWEAALS